MSLARVYRPTFGWKGIVGDIDDYYIGDVDGVIVGGAAPSPIGRFPGVVSTEGMVGIPYEQDSGVVVQQRDYIDIGDDRYVVAGPRQWEEDHAFAGTDVTEDYYWMQVEASHGGP